MNTNSIKSATIINFVARYSNIFIQLVINSILARILTPDDYGIVAVITVFISFFTIIADMGIGPAIIQYKDLKQREISDIFIFTIFAAIITAIGFTLFSYPLALFYDDSVYVKLGIVLSVAIVFNVLNIVPNALLLKARQFKSLGIRTVVITAIGGMVTIILATNGFKYYALVFNSVLVAILTFAGNFYSCDIKVFLSFNMESIKKIKGYSAYQFGFSIINYFSRNLDNLLIGKVFGQSALGYYDKAYKLMLYPVQNLTHVITPTLHPILSQYQNDKEIIYNSYIKVVKLLSLLATFFVVFCFFASKEIIIIMFGDQWLQSVPAFKLLSISIWAQMVTSSSSAIFQATGRTKAMFIQGIINTTITITCLFIGLNLGSIETVALLITIAFSLHFIFTYFILINYVFKSSMFKFIKTFFSSAIIMIIMVGVMILTKNIVYSSIIIMIAIKLFFAIVAYTIGIIITKEYKFIVRLFKR